MRARVVTAIVLALIAAGCFYDDLEQARLPSWTPQLALPLVSSELNAGDLLSNIGAQGYLRYDDDGAIVLTYEAVVLSAVAGEVFEVPPVHFEAGSLTDHAEIPFDMPQGNLLARLSLASGILTYTLEWSNPQQAEIIFSIPQITKDGEVLTELILADALQSAYTGTIDLSGYTFEFDTRDGRNFIDVVLETFSNGKLIHPVFGGLGVTLDDMDFLEVEGKLQSLHFDPRSDTLDLGLGRNWISGNVVFVKPRILLTVESDFGLPVLLRIDNFLAVSNTGTAQLSGSVINSAWEIPPASAAVVQDTLNATAANSNIVDFLSISPTHISYQVNLAANLLAGQSAVLRQNDQITMTAHLELPLECMIQDVVLLDTFDVEFPDVENLHSVDINLWFENSFPHTISAQVLLSDSTGVIIDSLLIGDDTFIVAGATNEAGDVISPGEKTSVVRLDMETLANLQRAQKIIIRAGLSTDEGGTRPVRYTTANHLRCKVSALATVSP